MNPLKEYARNLTRRQLLLNSSKALGAAALASLATPVRAEAPAQANSQLESAFGSPGQLGLPHFAPQAKRAIYLFMCGGPSHIDTFDFKPELRKIHGQELPASIRMGQRITGMTSGQKSFPCVAPMFQFAKYGQHGTYVSELLPHVASIVDDIAIVKSVNTEAINHDPAITYINTGSQAPGKASMGAWLSYGLGSPNQDLPAYIVMISAGPGQKQALYSRLWGSGFLPSKHQGVKLRSSNEPVQFLQDPVGVDRAMRRRMLDRIAELNQAHYEEFRDPETQTRIAQYTKWRFGCKLPCPKWST